MIKCICYKTEHKFKSTQEAQSFFMSAYYGCDSKSSEAGRYLNILRQLNDGQTVCIDLD